MAIISGSVAGTTAYATEAAAQQRTLASLPQWAQVRRAPVKRALVIGIGDYLQVTDLVTPVHDRRLVAESLRALGFSVTVLEADSPTRDEVMNAVDAFKRTLEPGDVAIIHFSGHGIERKGINYLVPAEAAAPREGRELYELVALDHLTDALTSANVAFGLVLLDACRSDPFVDGSEDVVLDLTAPPPVPAPQPVPGSVAEPAAAGAAGAAPSATLLARIASSPSVLIGFATAPGRKAYSLMRGDPETAGSLYSRTLAAQLGTPGRLITQDLSVISRTLSEMTGRRQEPWTATFAPPDLQLRPDAHHRAEQESTWLKAVGALTSMRDLTPMAEAKQLESYLTFNPVTEFSWAARRRLTDLRQANVLARLQASVDLGPRETDAGLRMVGGLKSLMIEWAGMNGAVAASDNVGFFASNPLNGRARRIGSLDAGETVTFLAALRPGEAPLVLRENGQVGFVLDARPVRTRAVATSTITFAGPDDLGDDVDPNLALDALAANGDAAEINVLVGLASEVHEGRGRQLAYARALGIREALIARGVPFEAVRMTIGDAAVAADTAQLNLNVLEETP
jgi:uncharacterized caspase-like protein